MSANAAAAIVPYIAFRYLPARQSLISAPNNLPSSTKRLSGPLATLGGVYARTGKRNEAEAIINELKEKFARRQANGYDIAKVYVALGDNGQAFDWLEKDFQAHSGLLPRVRWYVAYESLRSDPRYADLQRRMGLEP